MTGYLLDTNVISELRKKDRCKPAVRSWYDSVSSADHFLSVLVVGEIRNGIERIRRRDEASALALDRWVIGLEEMFIERILPVTNAIADRWGRLGVADPIPPIDGLLAATAIEHGLILATRNVSDISTTGAQVVNPFQAKPQTDR